MLEGLAPLANGVLGRRPAGLREGDFCSGAGAGSLVGGGGLDRMVLEAWLGWFVFLYPVLPLLQLSTAKPEKHRAGRLEVLFPNPIVLHL